ncbi:hypothetical protein PGB90_001646 [Kerria lacca]
MEEGKEQHIFLHDEVSYIIKCALDDVLGDKDYQQNKINVWKSRIFEISLHLLMKLNKSSKYLVSLIIMQKNGAGLHSASSCYWNNIKDDKCIVKWENKTIYCIVSVFGLLAI